MEDVKKSRVIAADRLDDSVIITFDDGRCGIYSSHLLYSMLPSSHELHGSDQMELEKAEDQ